MQNRKGMPTWLMSYLFPWQATTGNVSIERMDLKSIPVEDEKTSGRGRGGKMYYGYAGLRGILITRDAHSLYRKFGYEVLDGRVMVKNLNC